MTKRVNVTGIELQRAQDIEDGLMMSAIDLIGEPKGTCRSHRELAHYCGVSYQAIQRIERGAMEKVRCRLNGHLANWRELFARDSNEVTNETVGWGEGDDVRMACDAWARRTGRGRFA